MDANNNLLDIEDSFDFTQDEKQAMLQWVRTPLSALETFLISLCVVFYVWLYWVSNHWLPKSVEATPQNMLRSVSVYTAKTKFFFCTQWYCFICWRLRFQSIIAKVLSTLTNQPRQPIEFQGSFVYMCLYSVRFKFVCWEADDLGRRTSNAPRVCDQALTATSAVEWSEWR